jgi:glycerophosphoryl diester phosphodiesterase
VAAPPAARPLVLAHRGARERAPENTLAAFSLALELGADGVELDVHRTADDGLVVHHDAEAPELGILADLPFERIRAARPDVPTLGEVLDACAGSLVNVEIKNLPGDADFDPDERVADLVVDLLRERGGADHVLVSSFNLGTIDRVRELDPDLATGFLIMFGIDPLVALELCVERRHHALHPFVALLADEGAATTITRAHEHDVAVNVWTVNDPDDMRRLALAGVGALITDVPDVARGVIDD